MKKKLARDRIPDIIEESGKYPVIRYAESDELRNLLFAKFIEEVGEFFANPSPEEAADILEVLRAICSEFDMSMIQVHDAANKKYLDRGGFYEGVVLEDVKDSPDV